MFKELIIPDIKELIEVKDWKSLKFFLSECYPSDIADLIESLDKSDAAILFRLLPRTQAAAVFAEFDPQMKENLLKQMSNQHIKEILSELSPDDRNRTFGELPGKVTQKLLNLLPAEKRREALEILAYPKESIGKIITPDYIAVRPYWTIEQAIKHIRNLGKDAETINMIYVVDDEWHLLDDIPIRRFILADPKQKVESIMDGKFISISAFDDQEKAVHIMKRYDLLALPVTDSEGVLIGIVTIDDILDVLEKEMTEDFHKGSAVTPLEKNYASASFLFLYKRRVTWLFLLLVADFLSSSVIAHFEHALQAVIALAFFIPILIDSGGNVATQVATLVIRAISTGEISLKNWFNILKKELFIGILLGITLGITLFLRGFFWKGGPQVGIVVGISMVGIVLWPNLLGSLLPFILSKLKLDPAVISSPLLTTLVDATGLLLYFSIAKSILSI